MSLCASYHKRNFFGFVVKTKFLRRKGNDCLSIFYRALNYVLRLKFAFPLQYVRMSQLTSFKHGGQEYESICQGSVEEEEEEDRKHLKNSN